MQLPEDVVEAPLTDRPERELVAEPRELAVVVDG